MARTVERDVLVDTGTFRPCRDAEACCLYWTECREDAVFRVAAFTKHITWHQSRHTAATTVFLSNGVPIETVSSMLGHKSIKTTQIYAKITKEKLNQDMENLAARLNTIEEFAGCTI